ncbi:hypothetical protein RFI_01828 [Reticulomyxa filosa]|uniref:NAD-dependent epimerase/dehydratase domain-containing protein n=1 Tax=Reticulomyxa filosa TaxID=46433 RepID=X6P9L2_RETFI|nr:hypothetical protein RFI_01828 [Reticulomyxa filosa]|eukprot:ETO35235.1 hypothetical protein RFI_01828 [Reticulomyxa filosa]
MAEYTIVGDMPLVLVTGASGFIASHIIQQLCSEGYRVRGTVRNRKKCDLSHLLTGDKNDIELIECDLNSDKNWRKAVEKCDYVIHTAGILPSFRGAKKTQEDFLTPTIQGMQRILNACLQSRSVKKLVYTSTNGAMEALPSADPNTSCVFVSPEIWTDVTKPHVSFYAKSKTLAEKLAFDFVAKHNYPFQVVSIAPTLTLGPVLAPRFPESLSAIALLFNKHTAIPKIHYSICDVRDVASAHIAALTCDKANGKRYLICSDSIWYADIAKYLHFEFGTKGFIVSQRFEPYEYFVKKTSDSAFIRNLVLPMYGKLRVCDSKSTGSDLRVVHRPIRDVLFDSIKVSKCKICVCILNFDQGQIKCLKSFLFLFLTRKNNNKNTLTNNINFFVQILPQRKARIIGSPSVHFAKKKKKKN